MLGSAGVHFTCTWSLLQNKQQFRFESSDCRFGFGRQKVWGLCKFCTHLTPTSTGIFCTFLSFYLCRWCVLQPLPFQFSVFRVCFAHTGSISRLHVKKKYCHVITHSCSRTRAHKHHVWLQPLSASFFYWAFACWLTNRLSLSHHPPPPNHAVLLWANIFFSFSLPCLAFILCLCLSKTHIQCCFEIDVLFLKQPVMSNHTEI